MSKENKQWLADELPELLSKGVINQNTVDKLKAHFGLDALESEPAGLSKMTMILAAVGGLLIGGGIIMLFAHNWDNFGRSTRMALGLVPLIISQIFACLALFPKVRGVAWREASAAFMFCAVPTSIAIVGQTYHISDDAQAFQTLWFLLTLPFIYLLRSKLTAILAMVLATQMAIVYQGPYWLCAASLLPFYFLKEPFGRNVDNRKIGWVFAIGLSLSIFNAILPTLKDSSGLGTLVLMSGAVFVYLLGGFVEPRRGFWTRPFSNIGAVFIAANLLVYTFKDFWRTSNNVAITDLSSIEYPILIFVVLSVIGLLWAVRIKRYDLLPLASLLVLSIGLSIVLTPLWNPVIYALIANIVAIVLSVWYIWLGIKEDSTSRMNFGLILLMAVILMRFFDQDFSFIVKGIAFIIMGCAFIGVNLWQSKRVNKQTAKANLTTQGG